MLSDFFRINLPYGIRGNNKTGWFVFNREYKPIGFNDTKWVKYEDYPIFTKYNLTKKVMEKLSEKGGNIQKSGEIYSIFLYNDRTNPASNNGCWETYFEKIKILSKLKRT
jgi:hypothetical protein